MELRCLSPSGNIPEHRGNAPEAARKSIRSLLPHARAIVLCCCCTWCCYAHYHPTLNHLHNQNHHTLFQRSYSYATASEPCGCVMSCAGFISSLSNQHPPILISNPSPQSLQPPNFAIPHSWLHEREHPLGDIITTSCFTSRVWGDWAMG